VHSQDVSSEPRGLSELYKLFSSEMIRPSAPLPEPSRFVIPLDLFDPPARVERTPVLGRVYENGNSTPCKKLFDSIQ